MNPRTHVASMSILLAVAVAGVARAAEVASEPYAWKSVAIGANGFINGVVFGPAPGTPTYINTDMGGAYRLDGDTWTCLTDWIPADDWSLNMMGVETLAVDPTNPDKVYVALGTYMGPSAIVRSDDRGRSFKRTNVDFPQNGNGHGRNAGQRMNVDPNLPARLLYGTRNRGLYESRDAAATWRRVDAFPATCDATRPGKDVGLVWTLFDRSSGKPGAATPIAYVGHCTTTPAKLFRTLDAGRTWQPIPGQPGGALLPQRAALSADGKAMFATFVTAAETPGPGGVTGGAVWRCDDPAGAAPTWTDVTPKIPGSSAGPDAGKDGGFCGVSLSNESPGSLYVTTLNHYSGDGDDVLRSRDGGKTWTPLRIKHHRDDRGYPYVRDAGIHWTGDVQANPNDPNEGYFTTGYGLYRTTNLRDAEPTWAFYNKGFEQSAVLELKSPRSGSANLISAIGDRDGYRHEDLDASPKYGRLGQVNDAGQAKNLSMGTCNDLDVAYDRPGVCVRVGAGAQYSNDGGITWRTFGNEPPRNGFDESDRGAPRGPRAGRVAVAADASSVVWAPTGRPAMRARREGDGWSSWEPTGGLPDGAEVIADPAKAGTYYAIADKASYVSVDGGRSFRRQGEAFDTAGGARLRATPGHAGHLWFPAGKLGLQRSTDGGKTWSRVAPDVVAVARHVGVGAPKPGTAYPAIFIAATLGKTVGYFRSDDSGATWVRVNDDAHQYGGVSVINGDSRVHGRLYVGSNGRGILVGDPAGRR